MGYLCGVRSDTLTDSPFIGAYWETLVYAELRKQLAFKGLKPRLWYYRDQSQNEVDFVYEDGHQLHLYECKWTSSPTRNMASNLDKIAKIFAESSSTYKVTHKKLITRAEENFASDGLSYASLFKGLLENLQARNKSGHGPEVLVYSAGAPQPLNEVYKSFRAWNVSRFEGVSARQHAIHPARRDTQP